jgi:hypothetical protein
MSENPRYRAGKGTPIDDWAWYIDEEDTLPSFVEIEPDKFTAIERVPPDVLRRAATRLRKNAQALERRAAKYDALAQRHTS